jgi:hypothetical protein
MWQEKAELWAQNQRKNGRSMPGMAEIAVGCTFQAHLK